MTINKEQERIIEIINNMSQMEMAWIYRFSPLGHPYFDNQLPYSKVFHKRFDALGGFTPEISKALGF